MKPNGDDAALYVRVSSDDQKTANQEPELRRWAKRLGFKVVKVFSDTMSGALAATVREHRARGFTSRKIARLVDVGVGSVQRALHTSPTTLTRPRRRTRRRRMLNP